MLKGEKLVVQRKKQPTTPHQQEPSMRCVLCRVLLAFHASMPDSGSHATGQGIYKWFASAAMLLGVALILEFPEQAGNASSTSTSTVFYKPVSDHLTGTINVTYAFLFVLSRANIVKYSSQHFWHYMEFSYSIYKLLLCSKINKFVFGFILLFNP